LGEKISLLGESQKPADDNMMAAFSNQLRQREAFVGDSVMVVFSCLCLCFVEGCNVGNHRIPWSKGKDAGGSFHGTRERDRHYSEIFLFPPEK
jgi:hypothetical protein